MEFTEENSEFELDFGEIMEGGEVTGVSSVNGYTGDVVLSAQDVGAATPAQVAQAKADSQTYTDEKVAAVKEAVEAEIPTDTADLTNGAGFQNGVEVASAITSGISDHNSSATAHPAIRTQISTINSKIPAEASVSNQLSDKTFVSGLVSDEASARELADTNLQGQIDAITSASDVVDVVGTYSELQAYDKQHLKDNDIVKVLVDETHDNAITYYRWTHSTTPYSWIYIGSQGPFYTKAESDTLLNEKADKSNTYTKTEVDTALAGKVDKVAGKGLSTNDFTTEEKTKLAGLENTVLESTTGQSTTAGMTQKAITDALASAGGIKVLTTADYNWNTGGGQQEPYDCVAPFLLDKGIYQVPSSGIKVALANSDIVNNQFMTLFVSDKFYAPFECRRVIVIQKDVEIASYLTALNNGAIIKKENYLTAQQVVDSLTSTANDVPLSANQGKVLKDLIDSLVKYLATSSEYPNDADGNNGDICYSSYRQCWFIKVSGAWTILPVSVYKNSLCIRDPSTGNAFLEIGSSNDYYATKIGLLSAANPRSVGLGYKSSTRTVGTVSVGGSLLGTEGYKSTSYRVIENVHDGEEPHDAVNKQQLDAALAQIQALEARIAALEGNA